MRLAPLAAALILAAGPAVAQQQTRECAAFDKIQAAATKRGIEIVASGPTEGGSAMMLCRAKDDASWVIFEVTPTGKACVVGNGTDLEVVVPGKPGSAS